jgi:hypothetical protein
MAGIWHCTVICMGDHPHATPASGCFAIIRLYSPTKGAFDGSW